MNFLSTLNPRSVKINDKKYPKLIFRDFLKLELYKKELFGYFEKRDGNSFLQTIENIIELQLKDNFRQETLFDAFILVLTILNANEIEADVQFLRPSPDDKKPDDDITWKYEGRIYAEWIDIIARNYHWDLDKILNCNTDLIVYLLQEILVNEHLNKEWQYSLTEFAFSYDSKSGKSTYKPLKKPYWMEKISVIKDKVAKIPMSMLPAGVTSLSGIKDDIANAVAKKTVE